MDFKEVELEDWISCNVCKFLRSDNALVIGRQVNVFHGRIDLLLYDDSIYIVELKAREIQEKDIAQVLRYTSDIKNIIWSAGYEFCESYTENENRQYFGSSLKKYLEEFGNRTLQDNFTYSPVVPVLIGTDCKESIVSAMDGIYGEVYLCHKYESGDFEIEQLIPDKIDEDYTPRNTNWLDIYIGLSAKKAVNEADIEQHILAWELFGSSILGDNND